MTFPMGPSGDYGSWAEVERLVTGDHEVFRKKAMESALAVVEGRAIHVRDSFLFDEIVYSWPLLACLMYVAARSAGRISALDFGGGPAVTYLQNRRFLSSFEHVDWRIVEKPDYCEFCREKMPMPQISYYETIDAALAKGNRPDVAIFSAVLQILQDPYQPIAEVRDRGIEYILIDRLSMSLEERDRLAIYRAGTETLMTLPYWYLDERRLRETVGREYRLIEKFEAFKNPAPFPAEMAGFLFARR
jgi:putative methyltransferase (TIGR04325 family)